MSPILLPRSESTASSDMPDFMKDKTVLDPLLSHWAGWVGSSCGERKGGRVLVAFPLPGISETLWKGSFALNGGTAMGQGRSMET